MKPNRPAKGNSKADRYTSTEVGAILENIHKEVKTISESHSGLDQRLERLEVEVHGNSRRLDLVELRLGVINDKGSRLEDAVSKLSKDLKDTRQELKAEIQDTRQELKVDIQDLSSRLATVETHR